VPLVPEIVKALAKYEGKLSIRIVLTSSARHFLGGQSAEQPTVSSLLHMTNVDAVYDDADEWGPQPWKRGASILHIELRRWADMLVVARMFYPPSTWVRKEATNVDSGAALSANTLAKVSSQPSNALACASRLF
jgi:hypothetical protein